MKPDSPYTGYYNTDGIDGIVSIYNPYEGLTFTSKELAAPGETAEVSPDSPKETLLGVTVDFGEYNLSEARTLEIARLVDKSDSGAGIHAQSYNITLGDVKEFPAMVEVTLPYDPAGLSAAEEEYAISVGWYDERNGSWKILPSEVDTTANTVSFKTDHFTTFSVLKNTLTKGDIVFYYKDNTYKGPNTPVLVDTGALKKVLKDLNSDSFDKLLRDKAVPTNEFTSNGFGFINTIASGGDYLMGFDNHIRTLSSSAPSALAAKVGAKFTAIGAAAVAYKITDQWSRGVTADKIVRDNAFNLLELAVGAGVIATGSPFLLTCAAGIWAAGIVDSIMYDPEDLTQYLNYLEKSYDYFNRDHITYQNSAGQCSYKPFLPGSSSSLRSGERMLTGKSDWGAVVSGIYYKNKQYPNLIKSDVNQLIANYSDVFWTVPRADILYWIDESGILPPGSLAKDLPWPTDAAGIQKYKDRCQARTHERLQPLYKAMAEKELQDLWTAFYTSAFELANAFNETLTFEVKDPVLEKDGFANSSYAKNVLHLKTNGNYAFEDFICAERHGNSNRVFSCNVYHYITAGMPVELSIYPPGADIYTLVDQQVSFAADIPLTVIHLPSQDGIIGTWKLFVGIDDKGNLLDPVERVGQNTIYTFASDNTFTGTYHNPDFPDTTFSGTYEIKNSELRPGEFIYVATVESIHNPSNLPYRIMQTPMLKFYFTENDHGRRLLYEQNNPAYFTR